MYQNHKYMSQFCIIMFEYNVQSAVSLNFVDADAPT